MVESHIKETQSVTIFVTNKPHCSFVVLSANQRLSFLFWCFINEESYCPVDNVLSNFELSLNRPVSPNEKLVYNGGFHIFDCHYWQKNTVDTARILEGL